MRWGWIGAGALLVGCSRDNPWFHVDGEDGPPGSTSAADDSGTGPAASTSPIDSTSSTGPADASEDSGSVMQTDTGSDDTTTGEPPETTGTPDMTDTGGGDTTTGPDPTEGDVWHDLYQGCKSPDTSWLAVGPMGKPLICDTEIEKPKPAVQWAGWHDEVLYKNKVEEFVLALVPDVGAGPHITGTYNGLVMPNAKSPHLRTTAMCPVNQPQCQIQGNIRVEQDAEVVVGIEDFKLSSGQAFDIDIDLTPYPALRESTFTVVFVVTSTTYCPGNRGLWLAPRIVEVNP